MAEPYFPIVFTDLDGTLLDHDTYEFDLAATALRELQQRDVPIVLNTSKTAEESISLARRLNIIHPLIIENGGALVYSGKYVFELGRTQTATWDDDVITVPLGADKDSISSMLIDANKALSIAGCYQSFSSMTDLEVMRATGLAKDNARQARNRHFSEPILWQGTDAQLRAFAAFLKARGFRIIKGGRFHHVTGDSDKRTAMERIVSMYRNGAKNTRRLKIIALGDGANDVSMLEGADIAVVVRNDTQPKFFFEHPDLLRTTNSGPAGWQEAMERILSRF